MTVNAEGVVVAGQRPHRERLTCKKKNTQKKSVQYHIETEQDTALAPKGKCPEKLSILHVVHDAN